MRGAFRLGLTGSIGMGKSTLAALFADEGIAVWDADAAVHRLYAKGEAGARALGALFPRALRGGAVEREALRQIIADDPAALAKIEEAIHPLLAAQRARFVQSAPGALLVFDIPLLYEKGLEGEMDAVLLATAPPELQRARALARPGMSADHLERILALQMPDAQKRARADHIVETLALEPTRAYVRALIAHLRPPS